MPLGGDLGFSYLVLVAALVAPAVIAFVVRRKWRASVARTEEIKRLLVLASEETARAELEASTYVTSPALIPPPLPYRCAVCYSPTTTRCSRCKAVRYCSGKCQIIHWRQGHQAECRSITTTYPINDLGGGASQKVLKQEEEEIYGNSFETEERQYAESVKNLPEEPAFSKSNGSVDSFCGSDDSEVKCAANGKEKNSSSRETKRSVGHQSANVFPDKLETNCVDMDQNGPPSSKHNTSVGSVDRLTSSDVQGSDTTTVISDGAHSTTSGIKKPIDRAVLSEEIGEDVSKGRSSPLLSSPEKSNHMDVHTSSDSLVSKSREPRYTSSSAYAYPTSSAGGPSVSTHASKVSSIRSVSPKRSNHVSNGSSTTPRSLESKESGPLSSTTRRHSLQGAKSGKDDSAHAVSVSSSESTSYSPNAINGLKTSMLKVVGQLRASKSSRQSQSEVGSEIAGRYDNKGLFSYELFVKLYNWNKIELWPCGLINCGNSCYANAVLQCLACTPPLTAYLLQGLHSKACETKGWCFTCEFERLILKAKEGISPLSPIGILSQIQSNGSHLGNGRQEDAHEFLRYAIDTMQSVCLKEAGVNASGSLEEETTLIGLTFGGYLRSKIKCMKCGGKSERHERMMDLTVEIGGNIGTLEEALRQFTGTEILDGENKYQCSRCRSYERAKKKLTVLEAPNILTIALKRFQSGKFGKLNKSIQFPEILDLAPYMSGTSDKSPVYRLYGVVVHLDIMNATFSGHYVCYVKNVQNKWFKIDDSTVRAVELDSVLTEGAYMLLYARCSPRAPRLLRSSIIQRDPRKIESPTVNHWNVSRVVPVNGQTRIECLYPNHASFQPARTIFEEDNSSDNSSSIFSEVCSCSTDSSNRDTSSTDDHFDPLFGDLGHNWNSLWRHPLDSDSSTSSSSSSPSPLYSRHSPLADSDRYSSGYPETSGFQNQNGESDDHGFWGRIPSGSLNQEDEASNVPFLYCDRSSLCRKLVSTSCRETDLDRLRWANPSAYKKSDVCFRRSMSERTD
ncbi:ubiquitin carboxyl-terminal hydrolase 16-like isoform X2 [Camellia sinensis]|uniref:ubiquitin carboxyl-terminal hydrolase 16-like isoform X2 n=1 Tax=Camellia sinensis TaxID=4442 RepID=UPI001036468E|nr:ubiquitin carboxyl-terminal hydrolase 16-like isoform X2 [Camellia sinensis]